MGLFNRLSCEAGSFSCRHLNPQGVFNQWLEALFPHAGTLGFMVCLTPQLFLLVYLHMNVGPPTPPAATSPGPPVAALPAPFHNPPPLESSLPVCLSLPLLPVWMNVPSLSPWLSDLYTVGFSGSSGVFLFLNLLSFFWLCEEAQCVYLHLYLGR